MYKTIVCCTILHFLHCVSILPLCKHPLKKRNPISLYITVHDNILACKQIGRVTGTYVALYQYTSPVGKVKLISIASSFRFVKSKVFRISFSNTSCIFASVNLRKLADFSLFFRHTKRLYVSGGGETSSSKWNKNLQNECHSFERTPDNAYPGHFLYSKNNDLCAGSWR